MAITFYIGRIYRHVMLYGHNHDSRLTKGPESQVTDVVPNTIEGLLNVKADQLEWPAVALSIWNKVCGKQRGLLNALAYYEAMLMFLQ